MKLPIYLKNWKKILYQNNKELSDLLKHGEHLFVIILLQEKRFIDKLKIEIVNIHKLSRLKNQRKHDTLFRSERNCFYTEKD